MSTKLTSLLVLAILLGFALAYFFTKDAELALGAPTYTLHRSLLPETDSLYYVGSTSPNLTWKGAYFDEVCINGDCKTAWPAGGTGSAASKWATSTVDSTAIHTASAAKVGIGTTTPYASLSVTNTGTVPSFIVEDSTSPDATPFVIDSGGIIGIGTSSPNSITALEIQKSDATAYTPAANSDASIWIGNSNTTNGTFSVINLGTFSSTGLLRGSSEIAGIHEDHTSGSVDGELAFITRNADTMTEVMRLTNDGLVGIGTTTPGITGAGTTLAGRSLHTVSSNNAARLTVEGNTLAVIDLIDSGASANARWFQILADSDALTFRSHNDSGSTRNTVVTMTGAGNVGIGTTTPGYKLSISGTGGDQIELYGTGGAKSWRIGSGNNTTQNFSIIETGSAERFTIAAGGNVGIGTSSPAEMLEIWGDIKFGATGNVTRELIWERSGAERSKLYVNSGNDFVIQMNAIDRVFVDINTGNVGIGNNTPSEKLNVEGTVAAQVFTATSSTATSTFYSADLAATTGSANRWGLLFGGGNYGSITADPNSSAGLRITRLDTGPLTFGQNSNAAFKSQTFTPQMTLNTSGNLGIATTSPFTKLSVGGNAYIGGNLTATGTLSVSGVSTLTDVSFTNATGTKLAFNATDTTPPDNNAGVWSDSTGNINLGVMTDGKVQFYNGGILDTNFNIDFSAGGLGLGTAAVNNQRLTVRSGNIAGNAVFTLFEDSTGADRVVFREEGQVGIGTSTPGTLLDVFSTGTSTVRVDSNNASRGSCLVMKDRDGVGYTYITANDGVLTASTVSCE